MAEASDKPLILLADDDAEIRRLLKRALEKRAQLVEARDGEESLSAVIEHVPDLVILDVMMPGLSGWEVCKYIRSKPEYAQTRVIMLTAIGKTVNELTSPLYGADAYLDKPFDLTEMIGTIDRLLAEPREG